MARLIVPAAVIAASFLPIAANAASYFAKPVAPVAAKRIIQRDISWACGADACQGTTEYGRPLVLCQGLAKKTGRIERFVVNGRALGSGELERCNSVARGNK